MSRKYYISILYMLCFFFNCLEGYAQVSKDTTVANNRIRISILTCGAGKYLFEVLGHTAIRIIDSNKTGTERDLVFNYGTFDNFTSDFENDVVKGSMQYYLSKFTYELFDTLTRRSKRGLTEQVLLLGAPSRKKLADSLEVNALPAFKYYTYDFFKDNCATRVRDILQQTLGEGLKFGEIKEKNQLFTFRASMNNRFVGYRWIKLGANLLMGSNVDEKMSSEQAMYLPHYLKKGVDGAMLNGKPFAEQYATIHPYKKIMIEDNKPPIATLWLLVLIAIVSNVSQRFNWVAKTIEVATLLSTGILGILIIFMWFGTNYSVCENNWNILWALPFNTIILFLNKRVKIIYGIVGCILLVASLVVHFTKIQSLPLFDIIPIFILLTFTYLKMYKSHFSFYSLIKKH